MDKLKPEDAKKVLFDRLVYSRQWIRKFLPLEAKMMSKSRLIQPKRKNVIATSSQTHARILTPPRINIVDATILPKDGEEVEDRVEIKKLTITVATNRVHKFYVDILKIRDKAEKQGLKINSDLSVEVL